MATASHEHIPDLSASLSESHHRVPLSDLWGLPSGAKTRQAEVSADFALELARDTSRGPLMSSASAAGPLDGIDEPASPGDPTTAAPVAGSVPNSVIGSQPAHGFWSSPTTSSAPGVSGGVPFMSLAPTSSPNYPGSTGSVGSAVGSGVGPAPRASSVTNSVSSSSVGGPVGGTPVNGGPGVSSIGKFSQGIWGPRFSGFNKPGFFNGAGSAASSSPSNAPSSGTPTGQSFFNKSPWGVDMGVHSSVPGSVPTNIPGSVPVPGAVPPVNQQVAAGLPGSVPAGFHGVPAGANYSSTVAGSMPAMNSLQKAPTPPHGSPTPPAGAPAMNRVYVAQPRQATSPYPQQPMRAAHHAHSGSGRQTMPPGVIPSHVVPSVQQGIPHAGQHNGAQASPHGAAAATAVTGGPQGTYPHGGSHHGGHSSHGSHDSQNGHQRPPKKNGRPSTNTELYKTELCASYMSTGGNCPYGEKCQFAHGPEELKSVDRPPKWRSKPCQNWVKTGSCSYNERCCFRHDVPVGHGQQQ